MKEKEISAFRREHLGFEMCIRDRLEAEREELGQFICDDEQSQCHIGDMTGGNIGAALKQMCIRDSIYPPGAVYMPVFNRKPLSVIRTES